MDEMQRGAQFATKRVQAGINAETHVAEALYSAAKEILTLLPKFRNADGTLAREKEFTARAKGIILKQEDIIGQYTEEYAKAACTILGTDTQQIEMFLATESFGKTFAQRNRTYLQNFAEDIVRLIKAGTLLGYSDSQILSAVRTSYKDPYVSSVISKAISKDINIATPSYGRGIFKSAYQNIARNVRATIALAWGLAEQQYGKDSGAIGFRSFRGSSFPCPQCDDETTYIHKFGDPYPPYHVSCVCFIQFVYKQNKQ